MGGKWMELLKEAAPATTRALSLLQPDITANFAYFRAAEAAGDKLNVAVQAAGVHDAAGIEHSVGVFAREPNGSLIVLPNPVAGRHRELIVNLALTHRLPVIAAFRPYAASGLLMSYGPEVSDLYRRAASYVNRILRGEQAANLPVQVPTKFELTINLKTAKALGIEVPPMLLARADEVIE
jgi:putative ABC transport system substrate-binding protein